MINYVCTNIIDDLKQDNIAKMLLPLDVFGEIIQYMSYSEQGELRKTCKALSKLPITKQQLVNEKFIKRQLTEEPSITEIINFLFNEHDISKKGTIDLYTFKRGNRDPKELYYVYGYSCPLYITKHKTMGPRGRNDKYPTRKPCEYMFKSIEHVESYLGGYKLNYLNKMGSINELKLCKRILDQRMKLYKSHYDSDTIFLIVFKKIIRNMCVTNPENIYDDSINLEHIFNEPAQTLFAYISKSRWTSSEYKTDMLDFVNRLTKEDICI